MFRYRNWSHENASLALASGFALQNIFSSGYTNFQWDYFWKINLLYIEQKIFLYIDICQRNSLDKLPRTQEVATKFVSGFCKLLTISPNSKILYVVHHWKFLYFHQQRNWGWLWKSLACIHPKSELQSHAIQVQREQRGRKYKKYH